MTCNAQPWPDAAAAALLRERTVPLGTLRGGEEIPALAEAAILAALRSPLWPAGSGRPLRDAVAPGETVCLVVSDHTRKTAAHRVLPVLLREFREHGCDLSDFFLLFATGIHRAPRADEVTAILGPCVAEAFRDRMFFHNPDDPAGLVTVGATRSGHEVRINRRAMEADRRLLLGGVVYHYHAGFGGGRKSLVPGLAARTTIAYNHSLTLDPTRNRLRPGVGPGRLDGNPVAEEMLEAARLCRPDGIVNTVLTPAGELAGVFAGDLDLAHRAACRLAERVLSAPLDQAADLVVAGAGAARNWIQSHKALYNAHCAVTRGGWVVLLAPCPEGIGEESFRRWVRQPRLTDIYAGLRAQPEVLGQTALSTRVRGRRTILVTGMSAAEAGDLRMILAPDAATGIRLALSKLAARGVARPTCLLMPEAMALLPVPAG